MTTHALKSFTLYYYEDVNMKMNSRKMRLTSLKSMGKTNAPMNTIMSVATTPAIFQKSSEQYALGLYQPHCCRVGRRAI